MDRALLLALCAYFSFNVIGFVSGDDDDVFLRAGTPNTQPNSIFSPAGTSVVNAVSDLATLPGATNIQPNAVFSPAGTTLINAGADLATLPGTTISNFGNAATSFLNTGANFAVPTGFTNTQPTSLFSTVGNAGTGFLNTGTNLAGLQTGFDNGLFGGLGDVNNDFSSNPNNDFPDTDASFLLGQQNLASALALGGLGVGLGSFGSLGLSPYTRLLGGLGGLPVPLLGVTTAGQAPTAGIVASQAEPLMLTCENSNDAFRMVVNIESQAQTSQSRPGFLFGASRLQDQESTLSMDVSVQVTTSEPITAAVVLTTRAGDVANGCGSDNMGTVFTGERAVGFGTLAQSLLGRRVQPTDGEVAPLTLFPNRQTTVTVNQLEINQMQLMAGRGVAVVSSTVTDTYGNTAISGDIFACCSLGYDNRRRSLPASAAVTAFRRPSELPATTNRLLPEPEEETFATNFSPPQPTIKPVRSNWHPPQPTTETFATNINPPQPSKETFATNFSPPQPTIKPVRSNWHPPQPTTETFATNINPPQPSKETFATNFSPPQPTIKPVRSDWHPPQPTTETFATNINPPQPTEEPTGTYWHPPQPTEQPAGANVQSTEEPIGQNGYTSRPIEQPIETSTNRPQSTDQSVGRNRYVTNLLDQTVGNRDNLSPPNEQVPSLPNYPPRPADQRPALGGYPFQPSTSTSIQEGPNVPSNGPDFNGPPPHGTAPNLNQVGPNFPYDRRDLNGPPPHGTAPNSNQVGPNFPYDRRDFNGLPPHGTAPNLNQDRPNIPFDRRNFNSPPLPGNPNIRDPSVQDRNGYPSFPSPNDLGLRGHPNHPGQPVGNEVPQMPPEEPISDNYFRDIFLSLSSGSR